MVAALAEADPYLTVLQVAHEMKVSDQTVLNWIHQKKLPATKISRALRIRRSDLERMIAAHSTTTGEDSFWDDAEAQGFQRPG